MQKTKAALSTSFGKDVANMIIEYVMAKTRTDHYIGEAGEWETCISESVNWRNILIGACCGGHIELVKLVYYHSTSNQNLDLEDAHKYKSIRVMTRITDDLYDWNIYLYSACTSGNLEIAELLISYGAEDLNWALYRACQGGHSEVAKLLISHGAQYCRNDTKHCHPELIVTFAKK